MLGDEPCPRVPNLDPNTLPTTVSAEEIVPRRSIDRRGRHRDDLGARPAPVAVTEIGRMASAFIVAPREAASDAPFSVTVQVHADGRGVEARLRARYPQFLVTASLVPFHSRMKASLGGMLALEAQPQSPAVQQLHEGSFVAWTWQVKAHDQPGRDPPIEVQLYATAREDDAGEPDSPNGAPLVANVDITAPGWSLPEIAKTWGPVLGFATAIATAIASILGWLRKRAAPKKARAQPKRKPAATAAA